MNFYWTGRVYRDQVLREMYIDEICIDDGYSHFIIRWLILDNEPSAKIEIFSDVWNKIFDFNNILQILQKADPEIKPQELVTLLIKNGFTDNTEYKKARTRKSHLIVAIQDYISKKQPKGKALKFFLEELNYLENIDGVQ